MHVCISQRCATLHKLTPVWCHKLHCSNSGLRKSLLPRCALLALSPTFAVAGHRRFWGERAGCDGGGGSQRWLARNAAGVTTLISRQRIEAAPATSLVLCLPALEDVKLALPGLLEARDLRCLLEALSLCARLSASELSMADSDDESD